MLWPLIANLLGKKPLRDALQYAERFEDAAKRPREVQNNLLLRILEKQRNTQFGRDHCFTEIHTLAHFRKSVPITRYEDYEPYISEMRRGNFSALVSDGKLHMFALTSGTTAARKYIPVTPTYLEDYRRGWTLWGLRAWEHHPSAILRPILQMAGDWDEFRTEAGIPCGSVSGLTAAMQHPLIRWIYCVPAGVAKVKEPFAKYYLTLRLSLPRKVGTLISANPSTGVRLARLCDQEKETLIRDIHDGSLSERCEVPRKVRLALAHRLHRRNRKRARELERVVRETGNLYPKDCWPGLGVIGHWLGGSAAAYAPLVRKYFGDVPVRDLGLIASEGRMTIPLEDENPAGVLDIVTHFYEFVPEDAIDAKSPPVLKAEEIEEGRSYFVLLTTANGLYRYNIYDVVRVTGFHQSTPMVEFLNKGNGFASLTGEKLSEFQVVTAVAQAQRKLGIVLTAYVMAPRWDDAAPYYGLFVEREDMGMDKHRAGNLAMIVDDHLRDLNFEYRAKRTSGRLGPVRIVLVADHAWEDWDRKRWSTSGGSLEQYKHPCLVSDLSLSSQVPVEGEVEP